MEPLEFGLGPRTLVLTFLCLNFVICEVGFVMAPVDPNIKSFLPPYHSLDRLRLLIWSRNSFLPPLSCCVWSTYPLPLYLRLPHPWPQSVLGEIGKAIPLSPLDRPGSQGQVAKGLTQSPTAKSQPHGLQDPQSFLLNLPVSMCPRPNQTGCNFQTILLASPPPTNFFVLCPPQGI